MPDLLAARSQMAVSLAFHIIFAVVGIGMPALMVIAEWRWQRTGDAAYLELAKRWAKGTAILFAVGAVSGTVLSFELGLLWPGFMEHAGPIIGMPFSLEGFAFFTEAIFLGIYLYGWDRVPPRAHLGAGVVVAASGVLSGIFVVIANAWMNTPRGFRLVDGRMTDADPIAAMMTPAAFPQTLHMTLAAFAATGLAVAGIHAFALLRGRESAFHRRALTIALLVGAPAALLQPVSGDISARYVARWQPAKLAAMEGQFRTERGAPLRVGGWPDAERRETRWALEIPRGLSLLAFHDPDATVRGLEAFPRDQWPPVAIVHVAFQVMIALGTYMALVSAWALWRLARRRDLAASPLLLRALVAATPMGFIAVEAGWTVTEVGRQPWIVYGVMRTADAVTPMRGLAVPFVGFTLLYCVLGAIVVYLLYRQVIKTMPYTPPAWARGPPPTYTMAPLGRRGPTSRTCAPSTPRVGRRTGSVADLLTLPNALAAVILLSLTAYALLGGADFGGGVWDLLASGPRRRDQRALIADAIGPIWEANHVWLILVVVLLFTCFPRAFGALSIALHIPLTLMLVGIVLRGSAFTFRTYDSHRSAVQRRWGLIFAIASVVTPVMLGVCIGAVAAGRLPLRVAAGATFAELFVAPWLTPFTLGVGVLALALFAFLAAVYLTVEARDAALREDFRRRALGAAGAVFAAAFAVLLLASPEAPRGRRGLIASPWAMPIHALTGVAAVAAIWALWTRRFRLARVAAAAQVSFILWGWALAQYPYLVPPGLTITDAAAPERTLRLVLWALAAGALVLFPSLFYLFRIFKGRPEAFERLETQPPAPRDAAGDAPAGC